MGRKAGKSSSYHYYSKALKQSNIVWTDQSMFIFMSKPSKLIPGNRMVYSGVHDPQTRANIIAFLH